MMHIYKTPSMKRNVFFNYHN